ncbi:MAG: hypothetical protein RJA98_179 [Pseudomonadota bacterium]|jgi:two-component system OmpR family sensor kinase
MKLRRSPWRDNPSLQARLALASAALICVGGVLAAVAVHRKAYHFAHSLQDAQLQQVALLVAAGNPAVGVWHADGGPYARVEDRMTVEVLAAPTAAAQLEQLSSVAERSLSTAHRDGHEWRVATQALADGRLVVARQQTELQDEIAGHAAMDTLLPLLALFPVLVGLVIWVLRRTLAPIGKLGTQLDAACGAAPAALPVHNVPVELLPFVTSVNALMARLREALQRQQRFIADAAHELRTPVAALSLQAENLGRSDDPAQSAQRLAELQGGLARTKGLLEQLLSLSRLCPDSAQPAEVAQCEVLVVLREVVAELHPLALDKNIDVGLTEAQPARVACAAFELKTLLSNVVGNAIHHGRPGDVVDVAVWVAEGRLALHVDDSGPGIAAEHQDHVFEPFYKAGEGSGTGLGLAIVKGIADGMRGTVSLGPRPDGQTGCRFTLSAPVV